MKKTEKKEEIDIKKLNETIGLSKKILKIFYACLVLGIIVLTVYLGEKLNIFSIILNVLKVLSPLFLGIIIAWLLNPAVSWLSEKKVKRPIGAAIVFLLFIAVVYLVLRLILPMLYEQMNDFINTIPSLFLTIKDVLSNLFDKLSTSGIDFTQIEVNIYKAIENLSIELTTALPGKVIKVLTSAISGIGTFGIGLIIGFYLLIDFDAINHILDFVPKKHHIAVKNLAMKFNAVFKDFVGGTLFISFIVFTISSIAYWIVGLPSPLLFGFICGITNIIPYIGPWIGGGICVIVAITINPVIALLVVLIAFIVQQIDGIILQPVIMSRAVKLHPVTIMIGLLIFGHFFGILGMIFAVPVISSLKILLNYFDEKYDLMEKLKNKEE